MDRKIRNEGLDILKILAMGMVITLHYLLYGLELKQISNNTFLYHFSWGIEAFCICAVNTYILISGYFLSNKQYKIERIWSTWIKTVVISSIIFILLTVLKLETFTIKGLIYNLLPVITNRYWFISNYIIMLLVTPFLNLFINSNSRKNLSIAIFAMLILNIVFDFVGSTVWTSNRGMSWVWFVNLYLIAAYIKKNKNEAKGSKFLIYYIIFALLIYISKICIEYFTVNIYGESRYSSIMYNYNSPLCLLAAINLFVFFKGFNFNFKYKKLISYLSNSTLMVYIIHENEYLRKIIFDKLIFNTEKILINMVQLLIVILVIYAISTVINIFYEKIYIYLKNIIKSKKGCIKKYQFMK